MVQLQKKKETVYGVLSVNNNGVLCVGATAVCDEHIYLLAWNTPADMMTSKDDKVLYCTDAEEIEEAKTYDLHWCHVDATLIKKHLINCIARVTINS